MSGHMDQYIDVDTMTVKPSPQRIRNILTLEERVAAIQAYSVRPMYTKVAKMFNCSWEQIKNIIANRQAILEFYEATKSAERQHNPQLKHDFEARKRKIEFLGECVYEYIQRLQYHNKVDFTEELIRCKALEFRDVLHIEDFVPNKAWINQFKATFNFSLSNRQLRLTRAPPSTLGLRDIMTYCSKMRQQQKIAAAVASTPEHHRPNTYHKLSTMLSVCNENETVADQMRQRRQRKLNFMERALLEYATRAKFHLKLTLDDTRLCDTASSLRDILKIENFEPHLTWVKSFKSRYDFDTLVQGNLATSTRTPPLSLDLRDILSYCSRLEKNSQIGAADNLKCATTTTSPATQKILLPKSTPPATSQPTHLLKVPNANESVSLRNVHKPLPLPAVKSEIIDLAEDDETPKRKNTNDEPADAEQPALKIRKIESICAGSEMAYIMQHSPGHWSEPSDKDFQNYNSDGGDANSCSDNDKSVEILPKIVRNYKDALKLLKPLEEFAMLEENFRAIGLLGQLESVFKNPPNKKEYEDEAEVDN